MTDRPAVEPGSAATGQTGDEIASSDQEAALRLTGTIENMAPEQAAGKTVDERAALFALSATLYECLTGAGPFLRGSQRPYRLPMCL